MQVVNGADHPGMVGDRPAKVTPPPLELPGGLEDAPPPRSCLTSTPALGLLNQHHFYCAAAVLIPLPSRCEGVDSAFPGTGTDGVLVTSSVAAGTLVVHACCMDCLQGLAERAAGGGARSLGQEDSGAQADAHHRHHLVRAPPAWNRTAPCTCLRQLSSHASSAVRSPQEG